MRTDDIKHGRDLVQGVLATTVALNTDDVEPAHFLDTRYATQIRQPLSGVWDPLGQYNVRYGGSKGGKPFTVLRVFKAMEIDENR